MHTYIGQSFDGSKLNKYKHTLRGDNPKDALERFYYAHTFWDQPATWLITNENNENTYLLKIQPITIPQMKAEYAK